MSTIEKISKLVVVICWGNFTPEQANTMKDDVARLHHLGEDTWAEGRIVRQTDRLGLGDGELCSWIELALKQHSHKDHNLTAVYVVADKTEEEFAQLVAPLRAQFSTPIALVHPAELAA